MNRRCRVFALRSLSSEFIKSLQKCPWIRQSSIPTHMPSTNFTTLAQHKDGAKCLKMLIKDSIIPPRRLLQFGDSWWLLWLWTLRHTSRFALSPVYTRWLQKTNELQEHLDEKFDTQPRNLTNSLRLSCSEWHHGLNSVKTARHSKERSTEKRENEKVKLRLFTSSYPLAQLIHSYILLCSLFQKQTRDVVF
jgi:hypothetical protein